MSNKSDKIDVNIKRGQRVKFVRNMVGMTGEQFAERCDVVRSTITGWERGGENGLTEKGAKKIELAMEKEGISCSHLWLLHGIGSRPEIFDPSKLSRLYYPVLESNGNVAVKEPLIEASNGSFLEEIKFFEKHHPASFIYTLPDDSMLPIYQKHDCVGGLKLNYYQFELAQDKICIILLKSNPTPLLRRIKLEGHPFDSVSGYVINAEASVTCPPLYPTSIDNVIALVPVTRLWRKLELN
jgi:transcriptional regulator with XRE-family HTH domain